MLRLHGVSLFVGGKLLIADAEFQVVPEDRIAVVGRNGCGKSHLLKLLAGEIKPDIGERTIASNVSLALIDQALPDLNLSPIDYLKKNDPELQRLNAQYDNCDASGVEDLANQISELEDQRYTVMAPMVLLGLGLKKSELSTKMANISGGMRMRIGLAQALIRMPNILLLDEPTNHLDLESTFWLISFLNQYPKSSAIVVVTHDTRLLKEVTTSTAHLRAGTLTHFKGSFEQYRRMTAERESRDQDRNNELEKQIERHKEIYMRFRKLPAKRAAQAVAQLKKAEAKEQELVEIPVEEPIVEFVFNRLNSTESQLIRLTKCSIGYGTKSILTVPELVVTGQSKIGILGSNGQGKTTLIRSLLAKIPLISGNRDCTRLNIGYFSQDLMEELSAGQTVVQQFISGTGISTEGQVRSHLAKYGFHHDKIETLVGDLSGGERSRLLFALICARNPNLIILDEPTNHLDIESRESLIQAINQYNGAVILISHDADLLEQTMNVFWLVNAGTVNVYRGNLRDYQALISRTNEAQRFPAQGSRFFKQASSGQPSPTSFQSQP